MHLPAPSPEALRFKPPGTALDRSALKANATRSMTPTNASIFVELSNSRPLDDFVARKPAVLQRPAECSKASDFNSEYTGDHQRPDSVHPQLRPQRAQ